MREKLTYSNVIPTLCLVLLLGGGSAYAASHLKKESVGTKQLKNEAVTPMKLSQAAKEALTGPSGTQGPKGDPGARGERGEPGVRGERGERGEPGPAVEILPPGQSESGVWTTSASTGEWGMAPINFVPRLAQGIDHSHEKYLDVGATSPECPGPGEAAAGYLCVYTLWNYQMLFANFNSGSKSSAEADPTGVVLYVESEGSRGNIIGSWTYTAP